MPPLHRRRTPNSDPDPNARRWFDYLPDDVLILVFGQCRIDELLALRLASLRCRDLIAQYQATIIPSVARSTFPLLKHLLLPPSDPSEYSIQWLKRLVPQQLAAILVDRHRFAHGYSGHRYGIPAEDPFGDVLRLRVANGWRVLRRLSNISEEVYSMNPKSVLRHHSDLAWKVVHPSRFKFEVFKQREDMILQRRIEYIKTLTEDRARDYRLMFMLLSSAFRTSLSNLGDDYKPWVFDWGYGIDGQRLLRRGNSWLTWFVLHEGPDLFWDQWWALPTTSPSTKNHIRDRSIAAWFGEAKTAEESEAFVRQFLPKEWNDVNEKWHSIQRDYAREVQKAMEECAASKGDFATINPILYFTQYAEHLKTHEESGIEPVEEVLADVPFHVNFRCPEELWEKFCLVRDQRERKMEGLGARN